MTVWSWWKNGLIKKIRLTSKSMTSQPGLETIAIPILPNISQRKGNQKNEIWSINRIQKQKYLSSKIMQKMRQGD